jgi:hypothetical protein
MILKKKGDWPMMSRHKDVTNPSCRLNIEQSGPGDPVLKKHYKTKMSTLSSSCARIRHFIISCIFLL